MSETRARPGTTVQLAPDMWRIRLPTPFPGLPSVNVYAVREDDGSVSLVEAGMDVAGALDTLADGLARMGAGLGDIRRVLPTHGHVDHWGLLPVLAEHAELELWMSEGFETEAWLYDERDAVKARMAELFAHSGMSPADIEEMTKMPGGLGEFFPGGTPRADVVVADGETFRLGQRTIAAVWTPGHARGHVCLYDADHQELFSGDHVLPSISPHIGYNGSVPDPLGDFLESLEKVESLPMRRVYPAHGDTIGSTPGRRARQLRYHHERRLGAMAQVLRHGAARPVDVMEQVFRPNLLHFERRLALAETLAHLEHLRLDGQAGRDEDADGVWWYARAARG